MQWEEVVVGAPAPGQVRMRNTAVGVNFRDVLIRNGGHALKSLPSGLGLESAGVIDAIGEGVDGLHVGQRVAVVAGPDSAYAEERLVPAARVVQLPDAIDERTAASMMIRGMTVRDLLRETYAVQRGDTILIHAAAGGLGLIFCQWAKHLGATIIGTVSNAAKGEVARAHGCDHVILYDSDGDSDGDDFAARVRELTAGRGVAAVYDSVGRDTFEGSLACLRPRGVLASFGEASGDPPPIAPRRLGTLGSIYITHPSLPDYTATRAALLANAAELFAMVASGTIKIDSSQSYPLADAARAHTDIESRRITGSVVLIP